MERNLDRRVEVVFPVFDEQIKAHLRDRVLPVYLMDNVNAWNLGRDGCWKLVERDGNPPCDVQQSLLALYSGDGVLGRSRSSAGSE
jgi:polyphosphate kinase